MNDNIDISTQRREFVRGRLRRRNLLTDPTEQFKSWLGEAEKAGIVDITAMTLATVDAEGMPFQRMVLLKGLDSRGFVFFTNLASRKAKHLATNPNVCLHFAWLALDRQVIINGVVEPLTRIENWHYFASRPKDSQLSALVSKQSHPVDTRRVLEEKFRELKAKFANREIELPVFWGGYRVKPSLIEFWQGGTYRLHDRFLYTRQATDWGLERLSP